MIYCPECGFHQSAANRFCMRCGTALQVEGLTSAETGPFAITDEDLEDGRGQPPALTGPSLAVRSGGDGGPVGAMFSLTAERITIGRNPDCDIFLDDVTVSRNHAELVRGAEGFELHDFDSLNGTYVNRRRVERYAGLRDGDELQIGKFRLIFIDT